MNRKLITILLTWAAVLIACSYAQDNILKKYTITVFPRLKDYYPHFITESRYTRQLQEHRKQYAGHGTGNTSCLYSGKNYKYLGRFYERLNQLKQGKRKKVRVLHYGDSLLWDDNISGTVREHFTADFGNGGRGIVPVYPRTGTDLTAIKNRTRRDDFYYYQVDPSFLTDGSFRTWPVPDRRLGTLGDSVLPRSGRSKIVYAVPEQEPPVTLVRLFLRNNPLQRTGSGDAYSTYDLNITGTGTSISRTVRINGTQPYITGLALSPAREITIGFSGSSGAGQLPLIDAVNLEAAQGVVYSSIIRSGYHLAWFDIIPDRFHRAFFNAIDPDLVILQFGINESQSIVTVRHFDRETYRKQVSGWLEKMKQLAPGAGFIIIGPIERLWKKNGEYYPLKVMLQIREILRQEAEKNNMAFFDSYDFFGGKGHMQKLVENGYAIDDYTHISRSGGTYFAEGFYTSLYNEYIRYTGHRKELRVQKKIEIEREKNRAIQFNSKTYAYFFLVVLLISSVLLRFPRARVLFLTGASYYFYATWKVWAVVLIMASTVLDYSCSRQIGHAQAKGERGTVYLVFSLIGNLGMLFAFKYFDFFAGLTNSLLSASNSKYSVTLLDVAIPVGISFYTFQTLSYTIDVWKGKLKPDFSFSDFAFFVCFFPQLVAGPIVRARNFLSKMNKRKQHFTVNKNVVSVAVFLILTGLVKKMGADWLAVNIVDRVFKTPSMFSSVETLSAVYAYALQIYGDFSGYTDIAVGSAMLLGFNLTGNFDRPYMALSVSDFWRRWHISLGNWLRDYLYIGLGGNRRHVYFNLFFTMFICGMWHGAGFKYIIWGIYHGVFLVVERLSGINKLREAHFIQRWVRRFITFHIICLGWIIFRAKSWDNFVDVIGSLGELTLYTPNLGAVILAALGFGYFIHLTPLRMKRALKLTWQSIPGVFQGVLAALVTVFLYHIAIADIKPFIYFQF